ncbi:MAG TPA: hypothetical protein VGD94_18810 [Vicinamibacterales bacterium]
MNTRFRRYSTRADRQNGRRTNAISESGVHTPFSNPSTTHFVAVSPRKAIARRHFGERPNAKRPDSKLETTRRALSRTNPTTRVEQCVLDAYRRRWLGST